MSGSQWGAADVDRVDRIGATASGLCAIHCTLCAVLPVAFSALGIGFLFGATAEWIFTVGAVAFATGALVVGWKRHRSRRIAALFVVGMLGLLVSRGVEASGGDHYAEASEHDADTSERQDEEAHHEDAHHDSSHAIGAILGTASGLLLFGGHLMSLRASRVRPSRGSIA